MRGGTKVALQNANTWSKNQFFESQRSEPQQMSMQMNKASTHPEARAPQKCDGGVNRTAPSYQLHLYVYMSICISP